MNTRREKQRETKTPQPPKGEPKPRLRIVKLEERIAPKLALNHNETLVRDQA
jgi:hypothetical protein